MRTAIRSLKNGLLRRFGRDYSYTVGAYALTLPATHQLPAHQGWAPLYDRYFTPFFGLISESELEVTLIDIGANVGDTAAAVLTSAPRCSVICVEGSSVFLHYLRQNFEGHPGVEIVDAFVVPHEGAWEQVNDGSTGHLMLAGGGRPVGRTISIEALLEQARTEGLVVWKSDTDGFDVALLSSGFHLVTARCDVVWFELDPYLHRTPQTEIAELLSSIGDLDGWEVVIADNLGHVMAVVEAHEARRLLTQLTRWLDVQRRRGVRRVSYLDVWLVNVGRRPILASAVERMLTG